MPNKHPFIPSASVVLLRERNDQLEVLLLKKNANITFGDNWVFPGGRVDDLDLHILAAPNECSFTAERRTAVRECIEETGLTIDSHELVLISYWKTPVIRPKRFSTVFFLYDATHANQRINIDHGEIVDSQWLSVKQALMKHKQKNIVLAGPTFVTLTLLADKKTVKVASNFFKQRGVTSHTPKIQLIADGSIHLYEGDECYNLLDTEKASTDTSLLKLIESARQYHRLYMHTNKPWVYINTTEGLR